MSTAWVRHGYQRVTTYSYGARRGYEWEFWLAWKHRTIAHDWLRRIDRNPFAFRAHRRAFNLWGDAVDRTKRYGERRVEYEYQSPF